mgnify:CR=1 FL=1
MSVVVLNAFSYVYSISLVDRIILMILTILDKVKKQAMSRWYVNTMVTRVDSDL